MRLKIKLCVVFYDFTLRKTANRSNIRIAEESVTQLYGVEVPPPLLGKGIAMGGGVPPPPLKVRLYMRTIP